MFSRGEPTFSFLFNRGQINSASFSPHCYLLHLSPRLQHNPQLALPFTLPARFSFSYITEANSAVKKKKKKKKKRKETTAALTAPTQMRPSTGTTLTTSLTFSTTSGGKPAKGRYIDYLLPDPT